METLYTSVPMEVWGILTIISGVAILIKELFDKKFDSWTRISFSVIFFLTGVTALIYHDFPRFSNIMIIIIPIIFIPLFIVTLIFRFKNKHNKY